MNAGVLSTTTESSDPGPLSNHSHPANSCPTLDTMNSTIMGKDSRFISYKQTLNLDMMWLTIECSSRVTETDSGPFLNPHLSICCNGESATFKFSVFYHTVASGPVDANNVSSLIEQLLPESGYVVCPGISEYPSEIRFKTKHLHEWGRPFNRLDSDSCELWHIPNNNKQLPSSPLYNVCRPCKQLHHDIQQLAKRATDTSDAKKQARTSTSSNYGLKYLSPTSQKQRITRNIQERKHLQAKVHMLEPYNCELTDKQHIEMLKMVKELNKNSKAINELCKQADEVLGSDNNVLRASWEQDVIERLEYEKDQSKSVSGSRSNRWSQITLRMALAVYTRSPAAYEALRSFKLLQLPCVRTLKYFIDFNLEDSGDVEQRLVEKKAQYDKLVAMSKEKLSAKSRKIAMSNEDGNVQDVLPIGEGSLIIDEVKVGMKLLWSSRNQKFVGHAMTHEEMTTLCDVYRSLQPGFRQKRTSYILQTLWRDLTSDFDIVGPHYTSDGTMAHQFVMPCLMDAMFKFHKFGFKTVAVVSDGASSNLSMIKLMSGNEAKAYGFETCSDDTVGFSVSPWFTSPYTGKNVYFIICPTHQLKSMVAALYQSRPVDKGGTREFMCNGVNFGWTVIEDMYYREVERKRSSQCSLVPKLKPNHVYRDAWTRSNVIPSKIMQQDEVISELEEYLKSGDILDDATTSVQMVVKYLKALNSLFELSLLGKQVRVFKSDGHTIQRMDAGFNFFKTWCEDAIENGAFEDKVDDKRFISWQTWDLLRILYYGFKGLTSDFLQRNPGHHINPKRVNGSAIETIFGQLKYITGGQLTAATYETAKASLLTKQCVHGTRTSDEYRNTKLYIREAPLQRKK